MHVHFIFWKSSALITIVLWSKIKIFNWEKEEDNYESINVFWFYKTSEVYYILTGRVIIFAIHLYLSQPVIFTRVLM